VLRVGKVGGRFLTGGGALAGRSSFGLTWAGRRGRRWSLRWPLVRWLRTALLRWLNRRYLLAAALAVNGQPDCQAGQDYKTKHNNADSDNNGGIHLSFPFASNIVGRVLLASLPSILSEQSHTDYNSESYLCDRFTKFLASNMLQWKTKDHILRSDLPLFRVNRATHISFEDERLVRNR
jgi:hypothetical protein